MPKSDIEIAQEAEMLPIREMAERAGIDWSTCEPYGHYKAKVDIHSYADAPMKGKLILVTAINPTPAGEGKTTTSVGLHDALCRIGKSSMLALREPSLGPVFGIKGGAAGGGYAQVVPMEDINLHFTGDFHAIGAANNLIAAMLDNHVKQGNELDVDLNNVTWRRCVDMNDRQLRNVVDGLGTAGAGVAREDGFDITVASEVMAVFCLADGLDDLKRRLGRMVVAYSRSGESVTVADLRAEGACAALLKDAIKPNLVQTLEGNPAFVHGGPFANIAHGCNSVQARCGELGVNAVLAEHWAKGGEGAVALAEEVVRVCDGPSGFRFCYDAEQPVEEKIGAIATKIYHADGVDYAPKARKQLAALVANGFDELPVCMAKTQYSFTDDAAKLGAPEGFRITVRDLKVSAGAGFIVALTGEIMTMPGLPKVPAAERVDVTADGKIVGLF